MTDVFSVSSLEEYIKIVERFSPNFSLSRGQGSDLPLFPSALRRDQDGMRLYSKTTIQSFLEDFKFNSQMYIEGASSRAFFLFHFLLQWTRNHQVRAALFAV